MASFLATKRLRKEYIAIQRKSIENIVAAPLHSNILEWHYVIVGTSESCYEGGYYHGILRFPPEYPMKPPSVLMLTPNGRFKTNQRLCLSMSDFHPETWNPMWSVSSILTGLYSFMLENQSTLGSIVTSEAQKRRYAAASLEYNCSSPVFRKLFPDLVEKYRNRLETTKLQAVSVKSNHSENSDDAPCKEPSGPPRNPHRWNARTFLLCASLSVAVVGILMYLYKSRATSATG
uniref:E2 ubiquitin-conjugating enzyme n=1 Tax=Albugo laibachii Nc14 TaxID=890382 RepID=F0W8W6_9STRA|nr:ubiquitinconjugating enzyme E2 putative [Albugo laibachii Nc14]|eukprot:CCA17577.1 ubiquitinconjugating enzyme E2 putative [Albugo laibachii Nc14]